VTGETPSDRGVLGMEGGANMATDTLVGERDRLYKASAGKPRIVYVPEMSFVMIDGHGDPNTSPDYKDAIQALYAISYTLKFALKREPGIQYRVGPLEGLWWAEDMTRFGVDGKEGWNWTMMIAQPDAVTPERFELAREEARRKKQLPAIDGVRLERFEEGESAQVLHVGPFSAEGPTILELHAFIQEQGHSFDGKLQKHHEIYLSDPRRSAPEKWKTIIRQPFSGS
jgi:hypothetical protein